MKIAETLLCNQRLLNLGCGRFKMDRAVNVDILKELEPDVQHDLNKLPLPFEDESFDKICMYHVFEHLGDTWAIQMPYVEWFFKFWKEIWRICKHRSLVEVIVPNFEANTSWAWGDPGHVRTVCVDTFHYLSKKTYEVHKQVKSSITFYPLDFDFNIINVQTDFNGKVLCVILQAVKMEETK